MAIENPIAPIKLNPLTATSWKAADDADVVDVEAEEVMEEPVMLVLVVVVEA